MTQVLTDQIRQQVKAQLTAKPTPKVRPNRQRRTTAGLWAKPFYSDALGCNPDQIEETRAHLRANGVMADFDEEGRCIITSTKQIRDVAKASGLWDGRNGFGAANHDGQKILTGREQGEGQQALKARLTKEMAGYPSDFPNEQLRRI